MALAPAIESALRTGGILLVDELERELHPYTGELYHCKVPEQNRKSKWCTDRFYYTQYGADESGTTAKGSAVFCR